MTEEQIAVSNKFLELEEKIEKLEAEIEISRVENELCRVGVIKLAGCVEKLSLCIGVVGQKMIDSGLME